jgi:hypothetical protein
MAGWAVTGLFPVNPERVLRETQKAPAKLTAPKANNEMVISGLQEEVPQTSVTPITPVTTEALTSLQDFINQDAFTLARTSRQRLQRHGQKIASATQIPFQNQNPSLSKIKNEATVRRSTRLEVLRKAKGMRYEDLKEVQAKHVAKEKENAIAGNEKRGRKRKNPTTEGGSPEPKTKVVRMSEVPEPWRAPVARMY